MGFELEEDHFHLFFEDPRFAGLEVVIARMSVGESLDLDEARFAATSTTEEANANAERIVQIIGANLVSWNLERKGVPVPCDAAGLRAQDDRVLNAILAAYVQAVRGVAAPLALGSSGTGPTSSDTSPSQPAVPAGLSIPMEPLSPVP